MIDIPIYILQGSKPTACYKQTCLLFEEAVRFLVGPRGEKGSSLVEPYWEPRHFSYVDIIQTCWHISRVDLEMQVAPTNPRNKYSKNSTKAPEQSSVGNDTSIPWKYLA